MTSSWKFKVPHMHADMLKAALIVILLCAAAAAGAFFHVGGAKPTVTEAMRSLSSCFHRGAGTEDTYDAKCMSKKLDTLMGSYSTNDIMKHINASTTPRAVERNCHTIGHMIGHKTYDAVPDLEQAFALCTPLCRHACMHGAISEAVERELGASYEEDDLAHADAPELEQVGKKYCDRGRLLCHAIGHLLRMNSDSYQSALKTCGRMGTNREMCYSGVFMEDASVIESSVTGEEIAPAQYDSYTAPCAELPQKYKTQCYRYLPMYQSTIFTVRNIASSSAQLSLMEGACTSLPSDERAMCFFGLGGYSNRLRDDRGYPLDMNTFCNSFTAAADKRSCDIGVIRTILTMVPPSPQRLFAYCDARGDAQRVEYCYHIAFNIAGLTGNTPGVLTCTGAPSSACTAARSSYEAVKKTLPQFYYGPDGE